jgi:hypothetical protein
MMNPDRDEGKFEVYLRSFHPRQPRPLPGRGKVLLLRWRGPVIAVAVVGAVLAVALLSMRHRPVSAPSPMAGVETPRATDNGIAEQISLGRLSALANQDPARLEAQLDQISAKLLPDVRSGHGVLKTLSAE